ncbi:MAG: hypothetical protein JWP15_384 [Alphaproteobacteria bacterium]|nr:hypothetical protein [Alphaproteobacteria bacterium]
MKLADLPHRALRAGALIAIAGSAMLASQAAAQAPQGGTQARTSVHPYLEVQQVVSADFNGGGEVLTYTSVGAGIDASVSTRKVHATVNYNYQHYFSWKKGSRDSDSHEGLAAARLEVIPGAVAIDAGALATRSHGDSRNAGSGVPSGSGNANIYSIYAGPSLSTRAGPVTVAASYHLGYVKVDDNDIARSVAGQPRVDRYTSSTVHQADVSVGMAPGEAPFGWTVAGGWSHEDMNRFKSRYDGKYARADVVVPVSPYLAATGGVGYETIKASQQDIQRDSAGLPVVTAAGDVVADPSKPRLSTYDQDGIIWDGGLIWRPSPRTEVQGRFGRRYGSNTYTASLRQQLSRNYSLGAFVYDNVSSFGRLLISDLNSVPRNFNTRHNPTMTGIGPGGCIFGSQAGTGTCFNDALQSVANFNFRNRGATAVVSGSRGPWSFDLGAGYASRHYFAPPDAAFALRGVTDKSVTLDAVASRQLGNNSGYDIEAFGGWYDSGIAGDDSSFSSGLTLSYYRSLMGDHLQGNVSAGLYNNNAGTDNGTAGSLQLGLRYTF